MYMYVLVDDLSVFFGRQTRQHIQKWLKPGMKLIDVCEHLEDTARTLVEANGMKAGQLITTALYYTSLVC